jgi:hypothetical protein
MSNLGKKVRRKALVRAARLLRAADPTTTPRPLAAYVAAVELDVYDAVMTPTLEDRSAHDHVDD